MSELLGRMAIRTRLTLIVALVAAFALVALTIVAMIAAEDSLTSYTLFNTGEAIRTVQSDLDDQIDRLTRDLDLLETSSSTDRSIAKADIETVADREDIVVFEALDESGEPVDLEQLFTPIEGGAAEPWHPEGQVICRWFLPAESSCDANRTADNPRFVVVERLTSERVGGGLSGRQGVAIGRLLVSGDRQIVVVAASGLAGASSTPFWVPALILTGFFTLLIAVITWFALGQALRPVNAITDQVNLIGGESLDRRIPEPGAKDELRRLAETMNEMLGRLQQARDGQRRFVSDASHELRSPITATQATLEVARSNPSGTDWDSTSTVLLAENERLSNLVNDLLLLARLDEQSTGGTDDEVDLDEVCLAEADRPHGVDVVVRVVKPARVSASLPMVTRAVRNLIDNAARHAETLVEVEVDVAGDKSDRPCAVVRVADDGPGIPDDQLEAVFERFTRLDEARNRAQGGGAGLGLAIVRHIAEAYGGSTWAENRSRGGTVISFTLRL